MYEHDLADLWIFLTCSWVSSQPNSKSHLPFVFLHFRKERIAKTYKELGAVVALTFYSAKRHEMKGSSLEPAL